MKKNKILICLWAIGLLSLLYKTKCYAGEIPVQTVEEEYVHQEAFESDHQLSGISSLTEEYFSVGSWDLKEAYLTLYYTATPLAEPEVSDFTVYLNGHPIYSNNLPVTSGEVQGVKIALPIQEIGEGVNTLSLKTYIRTNKEEGCSDEVSGAAWMVINRESAVTVAYLPREEAEDISSFYNKFLSMEALENTESVIYLPSSPVDLELSMAANALANMAGGAGMYYEHIALNIMEENFFPDDKKYNMIFAVFDRLPDEILKLMSQEQINQAKATCLMAYYLTSNGNSLLLITGGDKEALENGVRALGNPDYMSQLTDSEKLFDSYAEGLKSAGDEGDKISLEERYVKGPFRQTISYYIEEGAGKQLSRGTQVRLAMRYSENLDFDRSLVTVFINDKPIGSKKLAQNSAGYDTLILDVPADIRVAGIFNLNVAFDLEIPDMDCTMRQEEMPWAYVSGDSQMQLAAENIPYLLFEYLPAPFISDGRMEDVAVILPKDPTKTEVETMRGIMLSLGKYQTNNTGLLRVKTEGYEEDISTANLIVIGIEKRNFFVREYNEQLYFSFSPKATTIVPNEKMKIEPVYGAGLGTAQLIYSPYSGGKKGILLVSGVTEKGMGYAASYLTDQTKSKELYGDGYVADRGSIHCFRFGEDNAQEEQLWEEIQEQEDTLIYILLGSVTVILLLLILLFLLVKYNKKKSKDV